MKGDVEEWLRRIRYFVDSGSEENDLNKKGAKAKSDNLYLKQDLHDNSQTESLYLQLTSPEEQSYLDKILFGMNDKTKAEFIDDLIKQRIELKYKMLSEIEREKDNFRNLLFRAQHGFLPASNLKELSRIYSLLNQLSIAEEVKCWKDTSFLHLKKLEEGLLEGYENEI